MFFRFYFGLNLTKILLNVPVALPGTHPASHAISILNLALGRPFPDVQFTNRQKHSQIPKSTGADSYLLDSVASSRGNDRTTETTIKLFL